MRALERHVASAEALIREAEPVGFSDVRIQFPEGNGVFCIFGLDGFDPGAALEWMKEQRWMCIVEDRAGALGFLLQHRDSEKLLNDPRFFLYFIETPLAYGKIAREIAWKAALQPLHLQETRAFQGMKQSLADCHLAAELLISDTADFGIKVFEQSQKNWKLKHPMRELLSLKDCFKDVPAIICGAGPSLELDAAAIGRMQDRGLIIAAGTAASILPSFGIEPHVAAILDPVMTMPRLPFGETPLCIQSRLPPFSIPLMQGEKILAPQGNTLPWEQWWFDLDGHFDLGWTVGNFASVCAVWFGCNPIVWSGMDFCYRGQTKYANGCGHDLQTLQKAINRQGILVSTQADWIMAAKWSEEFAKKHPERQFINTSKTSLIQDAIVRFESWENLEKKEFQASFDASGWVQQIMQTGLMINWERLAEKESEWSLSLKRCMDACLKIEHFDEVLLAGEIVYESYLSPLWTIWRPLYAREVGEIEIQVYRILFFQQILKRLAHEL